MCVFFCPPPPGVALFLYCLRFVPTLVFFYPLLYRGLFRYSEVYVPFCGLAVVEALSGKSTEVQDPMLSEQQQQDGRYEVRRRAGEAPRTRCMSRTGFRKSRTGFFEVARRL